MKLGARVLILCQPGSMLGKIAAAEGIEVRTCRMRKALRPPRDIFNNEIDCRRAD